MHDNPNPLPDLPGTHASSAVWLDGKPEVAFRDAGVGFIAANIRSRHGYVTIVGTEEWFDTFHAGLKAYAEARVTEVTP